MKKKYYKNQPYKKLFFLIVKQKYFELFLGIIASFFVSTLIYKTLLKNIKFNFSFYYPKIFKKNISLQETKKQKISTKKDKEKIYIVQSGDDLWHIAEKFYGSGFNAYDIAIANKIDPQSTLVEGQKLIIPSVKPRQPTKGETSSVQNISNKTKYIVQPGDSLSIIALKFYGDLYAWPKIMNANNLSNPDNIEVGMELIIP